MIRLKYLLLPIAGGLSAFLSFLFAAPYVHSLHREGLKPGDPLLLTTFGTAWSNVQHATFGIFLCGSFCLILESGRRSWIKVFQVTMLGMLLGGITNSIADSGSDYIGLASERTMGATGSLVGAGAWLILVPAALAFSIAFAMGITGPRIARALYATMVAAVMTFFGKIIGIIIVAGMAFKSMNVGDVLGGSQVSNLEKNVPAFLIEAVIVGIALGLTMARADRVSRAGSLRLIYGRKEYKDWSLDHSMNRLGSSEVEIPIYGFRGVEPVHACIFIQDSQFIFDSQHFPGLLNGQPVGQALLKNGDIIQIGEAQLVFYSKGAVRSQRVTLPVQMAIQSPVMQPVQSIQPQVQIASNQVQPLDPLGGIDPFQTKFADPLQSVQVQQDPPISVQPQLDSRFRLVDLAGKEYPLRLGVNTVGREVGNMVCFPSNTTVSRSHAQILVGDDEITVTDVGSSNGSGVNGEKVVAPVQIKDGDTVTFGSTTLIFRVLPNPD
jgi:pSer/pThr/pTyr-binding forkhead associated (FHA) protein